MMPLVSPSETPSSPGFFVPPPSVSSQMATPVITRSDLESRYPDSPLEGFVPTHWVRLRGSSAFFLVRLDPPDSKGVSWGYEPDHEPVPTFARISSGKWQSLTQAGIVEASPARYDPSWVPLHERNGMVYFIVSGESGPIKIGWSQDVARRITELQVANAHKLRVLGVTPGTMQTESDFHQKFAHLRMEAEWFQNHPEILEYVAKHCLVMASL